MLFAFCAASACGADSAARILDKTVAKLKATGASECNFQLQSASGAASGTIAVSGKKFKLSTPQFITWFDGYNMWTANSGTKEITLVNPTPRELREANPLEYMNGYKSSYNVYFSKRKDSNCHLILLNPKSKNSDVTAVEIAVNKKTFLPERMIIRDKNDNRTTINIYGMKLGVNKNADVFVCPVKSMKNYDLVDLR